jgi:hypothetical protein
MPISQTVERPEIEATDGRPGRYGPLAVLALSGLTIGLDATVLPDLSLFRQAPCITAQVTVFFAGLSWSGGLILLPLYFEALRAMAIVRTGLLLLGYGLGAITRGLAWGDCMITSRVRFASVTSCTGWLTG